ncbi:MAG: LysR family transcriptional regulator [Coriobacteriia bacterium]
MHLEVLSEFVTLAMKLNFTQAAQTTNTTQTTITKHIQQLEAEVGTPLFDRSTRSVTLTKAGLVFFNWAASVVQSQTQTMERIAAIAREKPHRVVVGGILVNAKALAVVIQAATVAARQCPSLDVHIFDEHTLQSKGRLTANDPIEAVAGGLIDVAIIYGCSSCGEHNLRYTPLYSERFSFYFSSDSPFAKFDSLRMHDLRELTFPVSVVTPTYTERIIEVCRQAGFEPHTSPRMYENMGDMMNIRSVDEVLVLPESMDGFVPNTRLSGLVKRNVEDIDARFEFGAITRDGDVDATAFIDALRLVLEDTSPD